MSSELSALERKDGDLSGIHECVVVPEGMPSYGVMMIRAKARGFREEFFAFRSNLKRCWVKANVGVRKRLSDEWLDVRCWEEFGERLQADVEEEALALVSGSCVEGSFQDLRRDVGWVYEHLLDKDVEAGDSPCLGAWGMLTWARGESDAFYRTMLPRIWPSGGVDSEGKLSEKQLAALEFAERQGVVES